MAGDRRVGVAMDFSPCSKAALRWATDNLVRDGDHLIIVNVQKEVSYEVGETQLWEATGSPLIPLSEVSDPTVMKKYGVKTDAEALDILNTVARQKQAIVVMKIYWGDAREKICEAIDNIPLSCLIIGNRGLSKIKSVTLETLELRVVADKRFVWVKTGPWTGPAGPYKTSSLNRGRRGRASHAVQLATGIGKELLEIYKCSQAVIFAVFVVENQIFEPNKDLGTYGGKKDRSIRREIGQMKYEISDLQTQVSYLKKDISVIHDKIDSNFSIMEEMLKKMLEGQTKISPSEVREGADSLESGENPKPIRQREDQEYVLLGVFMGSVSNFVVNNGSCPVTVVKSAEHEA
ncbi:hypothetical protein M5K25_005871 [Dendrobium thyrsiflorum]|uniref:UspA domain-containing protein n=1 Tax=Dendrobium thyrsiflorum TaxID=117978 RepID=A0ABD0VHD6_DENTH